MILCGGKMIDLGFPDFIHTVSRIGISKADVILCIKNGPHIIDIHRHDKNGIYQYRLEHTFLNFIKEP